MTRMLRQTMLAGAAVLVLGFCFVQACSATQAGSTDEPAPPMTDSPDVPSAIEPDASPATLPQTSPSPAVESGIQGETVISPTRPGPVALGQPSPIQPYQATIVVLDENGATVVRFQTDEQGYFRVALPPGTYTVRPESPGGPIFAKPQSVTVYEGAFTWVRVRYDTGMR